MNFQEILEQIREKYRSDLQHTLESLTGTALAYLEEDLRSAQLNDLSIPGVIPDTFMLRANSIGLALFDNGLFSAAENLYRSLAKMTAKYRDDTKNWRHVGVFYANSAAACFAQGNVDQGVIDLLRAAQDDLNTYTLEEIQESFAIQDLLPRYFGDHVKGTALKVVQKVNPPLTLADVTTLCLMLDSQQFFRDYIFLAYTHQAQRHIAANQKTPNEFSQLQLFSAVRSLSALFEVELKSIAGMPEAELMPVIQNLFSGKGWWRNFAHYINGLSRSIDNDLRIALSITPVNDESRFWKSLLVAYIVRNYTIHQLGIQCDLIQAYPEEALGHILNAMISAPKFI